MQRIAKWTNHTLKMQSSSSFGKNHKWKIVVDGRASEFSTNVTSYLPPKITEVYGPGAFQGATAGNQEVHIKEITSAQN